MGKKMAIIAAQGSLDWAYPPFILASTAAAMGMEVKVFFYVLRIAPFEAKVGGKSYACCQPRDAYENAFRT